MRISDWSSDVCSSDLFDCRVLWWPPSAMLFSLDSGATPVAVDVHFEDGCVVNETVDGCERHSGIREDPVPFTKRLVGGNHDRSSLISGADELEEDRCLCLVLGEIGRAHV